MRNDSEFLRALLGKPVRIVAVDERCLPPMSCLVLQEISELGVVAADSRMPHFFPWHEIVEIQPGEDAEVVDGLAADEELVQALLGVDAEP